MQLAIREGCGSPITCPDVVCLNHGTLQEAEVCMSATAFPLFPVDAAYEDLDSVSTLLPEGNFLKQFFLLLHTFGFFMHSVNAASDLSSIYMCQLECRSRSGIGKGASHLTDRL